MKTISPLALSLVTGCVTFDAPTAPPQEDNDRVCRADDAHPLVGQKASSETGSRALSITGARSLRWGPPGAMWTMDYRQDRVNVRYDEAMTITEVTCG